ncbi:PilW family protein [Roseateles agri]|uniref:PilW family protein n=1 Tax=Roseateles agri TaxID=3098619 RepID=UPI003D66F25F
MSLVELMVGITIGLIVVAAASLMMTNQVSENSRLLLETQLQQDLRAAADLMLRDLRRAGYTPASGTAVWTPTNTAIPTNAYAPMSKSKINDNLVYYAYATSNVAAATVPATNESFGFILDQSTSILYAYSRASFDVSKVPDEFVPTDGSTIRQPLTDPNTVKITDFKVTLVDQPMSVGSYANPYKNCAAGASGCPCLVVRRVDITITGQAKGDEKVQRTLQVSSRLRNDQVLPTCDLPS